MEFWYELASLPLKSVIKTLQPLEIESDNARGRVTHDNHFEENINTKVKISIQIHHMKSVIFQ